MKLLMVRGEAFSLLLISALSLSDEWAASFSTGTSLFFTSAELSRALKHSIQLGAD